MTSDPDVLGAHLLCVSTSYAGITFLLPRPEMILGRVEDNDIVIEHRSVSRNHIKIVFDGRIHKLIDLQSANGTLVNGEEFAVTDLQHGDLVELGYVKLRYLASGLSYIPTEEEAAEIANAQSARASIVAASTRTPVDDGTAAFPGPRGGVVEDAPLSEKEDTDPDVKPLRDSVPDLFIELTRDLGLTLRANPKKPCVFISWTDCHETPIQHVQAFVDRLERSGITVRVDFYDEPRGEDWISWMHRECRVADFVLVLVSSEYRARFEREKTGKGVAFEARLIALELYEAQGINKRILPVLFPSTHEEHIPTILRGYPNYQMPREQNALLRRIRGLPKLDRPTVDPVHTEPASFEQPRYGDDETWVLGEQLRSLSLQQARARAGGLNDAALNEEIKNLKRQIRSGRELVPGDVLDDRFQLLNAVGYGGFATVWRAHDLSLRKIVAVKVLHGQHIAERSRVERFFRGAASMQKLQHAGVVEVIESHCKDENKLFFVMEYLSEGDLAKKRRSHDFSIANAVDLIISVGDALTHAHQRGLIHRDVKPENILVTADLKPKLTDFDLVWGFDTTGGTRTGALGTYYYAAPEVLEDASRVDARCDIYSLGLTAFFVLSGRRPSPRAPGRAAIESLSLPSRLSAVLSKAVAESPSDRYATMTELREALSAAMAPHRPAFEPAQKPKGPFARAIRAVIGERDE